MTLRRNPFRSPALPGPAALLTAAVAGASGTAWREPGTGLLCAAAVLVLAGPGGSTHPGPPAWPAPAAPPGDQVGHPLVTELVSDLERADRDGTVLRRLSRRTQQALGLPAPPQARDIRDLTVVLGRSGQAGTDG